MKIQMILVAIIALIASSTSFADYPLFVDSGKLLRNSEYTDLHEHFRGFDLSQAPRTTKWEDLPDFFEERPPGSKSYHDHSKVILIHDNFPGEILYRPDKGLFVIQQDALISSTLTYFGPFKGDPMKVLKLKNPKIIKISAHQK